MGINFEADAKRPSGCCDRFIGGQWGDIIQRSGSVIQAVGSSLIHPSGPDLSSAGKSNARQCQPQASLTQLE
jgi:hypothetical protein